MTFFDEPRPSVSKEEKEGGWLVVSLNLEGKARQERFFNSKAEADAYWLQQTGKIPK